MSDLSIQEIVPGVHAVLGGICNRGVISHAGSALVVDRGISAAEAVPFRAAAHAARTSQERQKHGTLHPLYLFNTHPHSDHWLVALNTEVGEAIASGWDRETAITRVSQQFRKQQHLEKEQKLAPRGEEERLPNMIGQAFDELSIE